MKIVDPNLSVPYFYDAAFDFGGNKSTVDLEKGFVIVLFMKDELSYKIRVTTPEQA